jgi:hypothetical protein
MMDLDKCADLWIEHGNAWEIHLESCNTCSSWVNADTEGKSPISSLKCDDGRKIQVVLADIRMKLAFPHLFMANEDVTE